MGFNSLTLMGLPFGLLLPAIIVILLMFAKRKKSVTFDSVFMGIGAFFASIAAVAVVFVVINTLLSSGLVFSDQDEGMHIAGVIISVVIAAIFVVCESFKMSVIKKFQSADYPKELSSLGFSAGVIIAQNAVVFVALSMFSIYEMDIGYAVFSGVILLVTGVMYTALALASEYILKEGYKAPAYAISSIYYIFWLALVNLISLMSDNFVVLYVVSAFIYVLALVLSGVFIFKFNKKTGEKKWF